MEVSSFCAEQLLSTADAAAEREWGCRCEESEGQGGNGCTVRGSENGVQGDEGQGDQRGANKAN
jgi:hypothetical protein